jgi:hypothetical protein
MTIMAKITLRHRSYSFYVLTFQHNDSGFKTKAIGSPFYVFKKPGAFNIRETNRDDRAGMIFLEGDEQCIFIMPGLRHIEQR